MKTKKFKKLKFDMAFRTVIKILFYSIIVLVVLMYLFDDLLNDYIADKLVAFDGVLWYKIMECKTPIVLVIYSIVIALVSFFVIKHESEYMDKIFTSINSILAEPEKEVKINNGLELLEIELDKIRMTMLDNINRAKDEENKRNDLIMYMAHDLKTPLTSVIGYLTLLSDEKKISGSMRDRYIDIALDKALRVEELTNQFFEITRYNLYEMELIKKDIDLTLLLEQLIDECYPMLQDKKLNIDFEHKDKVEYYGDGNLLARAFGNLIKNAINYSNPQTRIKLSILETDNNIELVFKNVGEKIPEYKLERIFEKFYRVDEARTSKTGGAGVGLSITKDIIELHDGSISVKNEDKYIIFTINLPKKLCK
ncbi:MAG: HAMP domain-containing histidine kinase [Bacilli bacterium]|nr:HAMP domain-containing histidine kinase [Bacilli bacterium]